MLKDPTPRGQRVPVTAGAQALAAIRAELPGPTPALR